MNKLQTGFLIFQALQERSNVYIIVCYEHTIVGGGGIMSGHVLSCFNSKLLDEVI
jgi:hypothetical protein